jgi:hypothetical protein
MSARVSVVLIVCVTSLLAACSSGPQQNGEEAEEETPIWETGKTTAPERPEYHAESDAERLGRGESRALKQAACADSEDPAACREEAGRTLRGYRGAFSQPGADEVLVGVDDAAVLLARQSGGWRVSSRLDGVDVGMCVLAHEITDESPQELLCRAASDRRGGLGLGFFRLSADDGGELQLAALDVPHATDVDAALFAGWKNADGRVEVRFHKETEIRGGKTIDFDKPQDTGECPYRTFRYDAQTDGALVELDGCADQSPAAARKKGGYENRLSGPIQARNHHYATCYHVELERLKSLAERWHDLEDVRELVESDDDEPKELDDIVDVDEYDDEEIELISMSEPPEPIAGEVHVRFVVGSPGAPVSCEVAETTLDNESVESCLCHEILKTPFPPVPAGGFADVTYPFSFSPQY